jgi:poly(A) polymerase
MSRGRDEADPQDDAAHSAEVLATRAADALRASEPSGALDASAGLRIVPASSIDPAHVDQDALRVLSRLQRNGFEAYLVGGCVRDLLLGRKPKDFDVATNAHPRAVRRLFRNARIIGRRFRLVHVVYGPHVIETSTFRSAPPPVEEENGDLLIVEDNVYGSAAEDARRRDFTVNALFLEPTRWEIHDWVGGLSDIESGLLRTIGAPRVRFAEDPVRILRAIKFATRLGFRIEDETWAAMGELHDELVRSAPPRVFEEILRLLASGTALGAFRMLRACGALRTLLPEVDDYLGARDDPDPAAHDRADSYWRLLEALDADVHARRAPTSAVMLAVIFMRVVEREAERLHVAGGDASAASVSLAPGTLATADLAAAAEHVFEPVAEKARLARRAIERAKQLIVNQRRFTQPSTKGFRPLLFLRGEDFAESLHLFRLRSAAWGQGWDVVEGWIERHRQALEVPEEELADMRQRKRRRHRRGRRGGRRGRCGEELSYAEGEGGEPAAQPPGASAPPAD